MSHESKNIMVGYLENFRDLWTGSNNEQVMYSGKKHKSTLLMVEIAVIA